MTFLIQVALGIGFGLTIIFVLRALGTSKQLAGVLGIFFGTALGILLESALFEA